MTMRFATPVALALLVTVAVPWLLARRRPSRERRAVGNLFLWRDARPLAQGHVARRRRRVSTSMLLQMLTIATAVLALARPALVMPASRITFVFDLSASMAARDGRDSRLGAARAAAHAVLTRLPRASRIRVIAAAANARDLGEYSATDPSLGRLIDRLQATAGDADLRAAVAVALARDAHSPVRVFSDAEAPSASDAGERDAPVQWVRVGTAVDNLAITELSARRSRLGSAAGDVFVEVRNFGVRAADARVEVATDARPVVAQAVHLPAKGAATFSAGVGALGQVVTARLLGRDALAVDDIRYVRVPASDRLSVALIGRRGSFVERALEANPLVSLQILDDSTSSHAALEGADVVVCDSCSAPPPAVRSSLLLFPTGASQTVRPLTVADPDHPLTDAVEVVDEAVAPIVGRGPHSAFAGRNGGDSAHTVLRAGDVPVLAAFDGEQQRVVEWRIDVAQNGFALSPLFPVLMARAIQWLARRDQERLDVRAGEPLHVVLRSGSGSDRPSIIGPDGRPREAVRIGDEVVVADTDVPGPYTVRSSDRVRIAVVNPSVGTESDLALPSRSNRVAPGSPVRASTAPLSLAPVCAMLCVALIAVEWRYRVRGAA